MALHCGKTPAEASRAGSPGHPKGRSPFTVPLTLPLSRSIHARFTDRGLFALDDLSAKAYEVLELRYPGPNVIRGPIRLLGRVSSWFRRKTRPADGFTRVERPDGSTALLDPATRDYFESSAPDPSRESLDRVLSAARRVRILRGGMDAGVPVGNDVLFETDDPSALASLRKALQIVDEPAGHCMCPGDPTLELLGTDLERLAVIGHHHGESIRWDGWRDDAELVDGRRLLEWLAFQGISYPLDEYRHAERDAESRDAALARWREVMPSCLRPFAEHIAQQMDELGTLSDVSPL